MKNKFIEMKALITCCMAVISMFCIATSCEKSGDGNGIVGTWQEVGNASYPEILEISRNGDWHTYQKDFAYASDRWGEYTYDARSGTIVVSIRAVSGNNGAYTAIYVIQHLSETRMTLICDRYSESARAYKKVK